MRLVFFSVQLKEELGLFGSRSNRLAGIQLSDLLTTRNRSSPQ